MPLLSKKAFALSAKKSDKTKFKSPAANKKNIENILKHKKVQDGLQTLPKVSKEKKKTTLRKNPSVTLSFEIEPKKNSNISSRLNEPELKKEYLEFVSKLNKPTPEDASGNSSLSHIHDSEIESVLSQEILNRSDVKEKYVEFWNRSITPSVRSEIQTFSQEFKKDKAQKNESESTKKKNKSLIKAKQVPKEKIGVQKSVKDTKKLSKKVEAKKNNVKNATPKKVVPTALTKMKHVSEEFEDMDIYKKMSLIHESRNVGIYVFCDKCDKVRYLPDVKDPLDLPHKWFCWLNPDTHQNKCSDEEVVIDPEEEKFLINNLFNAGSIVWAKMDGYPWWPAMVEDDPDTEVYFWLEECIIEPTYYHVTFFDSYEVTRAWIKPAYLKPFEKNMFNPEFKPSKLDKFRARVEASFKQAQTAIQLPLLERLKTYSFIHRYKKPLKRRVIKQKTTVNNRSQQVNKQKTHLIKRTSVVEDNPQVQKEKKRKRIIEIQASEESIGDPNINKILECNLDLQSALEENINFTYF